MLRELNVVYPRATQNSNQSYSAIPIHNKQVSVDPIHIKIHETTHYYSPLKKNTTSISFLLSFGVLYDPETNYVCI